MLDIIWQTLQEWKARILAGLPVLVGLVDVLEPKWIVNIVGPEKEGWVYVALVGGGFLLHQLIPNPPEEKK